MFDAEKIDWEKVDGLLPAIVQDASNLRVLMLGFMSLDALEKTIEIGRVTFWSRTRSTLWTKGETSGNYLQLDSLTLDCDRDTLLVRARPQGPVCHQGTATCFDDEEELGPGAGFLNDLEGIILERRSQPNSKSYTTSLFQAGREKILQKLGEEAVEVLVSSLQSRRRTIEESADLLYHLLVFLADREIRLSEVLEELTRRHQRARQ